MQESKKILDEISSKSFDNEFYTPVPEGYKAGRCKYVIITGSVMSGVGKGIFSSSLGNVLKCHGFKVSPIKFDGYLNYDAGTLNPYRHGEVFVLDDGMECDLDLGSYERFLNQNLSRQNYMTAGRIFKDIIDKERAGKFLGRDVQFIPHVTGEIKRFLRENALKTEADIVLVEVGGTAGDLENSYFIEAMRELSYEEGKENVCFVNVTYILQPSSLGEHKSKPAQLGLRTLMSMGIAPHIVACRSRAEVPNSVREKISVVANVPLNRVINLINADTIYDIPVYLKEIGVDKEVLDILKLEPKKNYSNTLTFDSWKKLADNMKHLDKEVTIGIAGKYTNVQDSYLSILKAFEHVSSALKVKVNIKWIETTNITEKNAAEHLKGLDGILVPGGFGTRGVEGKIACAEYARANNIPYLGLCLGFQMALIAFARNVLKLEGANSTEMDKDTKYPVICLLPEQYEIEGLGGNMRLGGKDVVIKENTIAHKLYGSSEARERFRHRWECNPGYIEKFESAGIVFSGIASGNQKIMQILEIPSHKFFMASQFHPELSSKPLKPHPLFLGFVQAMIN